MWVTFEVESDDRVGIHSTKCQPQDEEPIALQLTVSTSALLQYLLDKSGRSLEDVLEKGKIKINMKLSDYNKFFLEPTRPTPTNLQSEDAGILIARMLELQQQHMIQQSELFQTIASTMQAANKPRFKMVKPDNFDGSSSSPECWINFYEYACGQNNWNTDDDKVKNLRLFLDGMAKKWYELRVLSHERESWHEWRDNFLCSFGVNKVQAWDHAIA